MLLLSVELSSFLLLQPTSHWPRQPAQAEAAVSTTVLTEADSQAEQARLDVSQSADAALPLRPNSTNNISVYCVQNSYIYIHPGKNMQKKVALSPAEYLQGERRKREKKGRERGRSS